MDMERGHVAVLQSEALQALAISRSGIYLDGTYGRGGHSGLILDQLGSEGRLIALDQDPAAISDGRARFGTDVRFTLLKRNFEQIESIAHECGVAGNVSGILLDLGVSSPQLDEADRGFSFNRDGKLDMRMDPDSGESAADWLANVSESELTRVLREYGEERFAKRIARAIVKARAESPLTSTRQLAEIVKEAHPRWDHQRHPATRSFQAIRIAVNRELAVLQSALEQSVRILARGGRLVVISFHSLEDRAVKRFMRGSSDVRAPRRLPVHDGQIAQRALRQVAKYRPGADELSRNPRSRSAVLRVAEKLV